MCHYLSHKEKGNFIDFFHDMKTTRLWVNEWMFVSCSFKCVEFHLYCLIKIQKIQGELHGTWLIVSLVSLALFDCCNFLECKKIMLVPIWIISSKIYDSWWENWKRHVENAVEINIFPMFISWSHIYAHDDAPNSFQIDRNSLKCPNFPLLMSHTWNIKLFSSSSYLKESQTVHSVQLT